MVTMHSPTKNQYSGGIVIPTIENPTPLQSATEKPIQATPTVVKPITEVKPSTTKANIQPKIKPHSEPKPFVGDYIAKSNPLSSLKQEEPSFEIPATPIEIAKPDEASALDTVPSTVTANGSVVFNISGAHANITIMQGEASQVSTQPLVDMKAILALTTLEAIEEASSNLKEASDLLLAKKLILEAEAKYK